MPRKDYRRIATELGMSPEEYRSAMAEAEKYGVIPPQKDGVIEETWEGVQSGALQAVKGLGSTLDEAGLGDGLYEYAKGIDERNQDLRPDPTYKATSFDPAHIGRTIGAGVGQSGTSLVAGVATTAATGGNALAGGSVITGMVFAQTYGDEVKDFRKLMPNQDEGTVRGLAFVSSLGQSLIESVAGPEAIASGVAKKIVTGAVKDTVKQYGKKRVLQVLKTVGKNAVKGGLGEGSEEVFQGIVSNIAKRSGGVDVPIFNFNEAVEQFAGGALPGAVMSGVAGGVEANQQADAIQPEAAPDFGVTPQVESKPIDITKEVVPAEDENGTDGQGQSPSDTKAMDGKQTSTDGGVVQAAEEPVKVGTIDASGMVEREQEQAPVQEKAKATEQKAVNWNADGIGGVPDNRDIAYRGFVLEMSAKEFRRLVPKGNWDKKAPAYISEQMKKGEAIGNPFLLVEWDDKNKVWVVYDHEGRSRVDAAGMVAPNEKVPVHLIPYKMRAKDITPEMQNAPFISQVDSEVMEYESMQDIPTRYRVESQNEQKTSSEAVKNIALESNPEATLTENPEQKSKQVNPFKTPEVKQVYDNILDEYEPERRSHAMLDAKAEDTIKKHGVKKLVDSYAAGKWKADTDAKTRLALKLGESADFRQMIRDGDPAATSFLQNYPSDGTRAGQLLAARKVLESTGDWRSDMQNSLIKVFNEFTKGYKKAKDKTMAIKKEIEIQNKIEKKLNNIGVDIFNLTKEQADDRLLMAKAAQIISTGKASKGDIAYEYWINAILSGAKTAAANATGNTSMAALELVPQRFVEAAINLAIRNPKAATFGEFKAMWNGFKESIKPALKNTKEAWNTEKPVTDDMAKIEQMHGASIPGIAGRIIRVPTRALIAADELAKTLVGTTEASAYAYRQAKEQGLKGQATKDFIANAVKNSESDASKWGRLRAENLAFQTKLEKTGLDGVVNHLIHIKESGGIAGNILKFVFPFSRTPWNIVKTGMRKSPLGGISLTKDLLTGKVKFSDEKFIHHLSEQILAWGTIMAISSMMGDDDEPMITGAKGRYGTSEYNWKRQNLPATSIKIGGQWYDYSRIEPFAGAIASIVDGINAWSMVKRGDDGTKITKHLVNSFKQNFQSKSFLQGIGDLMNALESDYTTAIPRQVSNFTASWIPNIVRSTLTSADDKIRDRRNYERGAAWLKDQMIMKPLEKAGFIKGLPKVDLWGNDIENRNVGALVPPLVWKIVSPSLTQPTDMDRKDALIWNWNRNNPNDEYWPGLPSPSQKMTKTQLYMKGNEYYEFCKESGALAGQMLDRAIDTGRIDYQNPTEKDIEKMKKIFRMARKITKTRSLRK